MLKANLQTGRSFSMFSFSLFPIFFFSSKIRRPSFSLLYNRLLILQSSTSHYSSSRNSLMSSQRSSDGDKLTPSQTYSSTRGPLGLDVRQHHSHLLNAHHNNHLDDDDKLLDVVGPSSPLLSSLQHMQSQAHGERKRQSI